MLITRIAVQFIGQIGALVWLRRHRAELRRPFRMWLYPLPALVALTITGAAFQRLRTTPAADGFNRPWPRWP